MTPLLFTKAMIRLGSDSFPGRGIGALTEATKCIVTEERHGLFELEMEYPASGKYTEFIAPDNFILTKASPSVTRNRQLFRIYEVDKRIDGVLNVYAEHISYQLRMIPLMPFTATGAEGTLEAIPENTAETCPFTFWTNIESERVYKLPYPDSVRGKLQGDQWSILQNFGGEYEFDNFTVKLWDHRGSDNGFVVKYGQNLLDLEQENSIQNTYTGIVPYWYGYTGTGDTQEVVTLPEMALYSENRYAFGYPRTITVDFTEDFPEKPTVEELRARGNRYLSDNEIGVPRLSLRVSFVDLSKTEEYKNIYQYQSVELCDTISVYFERLGVSAKAKVTRTTYNVLLDRYDDIYIGDSYTSLAGTIAEQSEEISSLSGNTRPFPGLVPSFASFSVSAGASKTLTVPANSVHFLIASGSAPNNYHAIFLVGRTSSGTTANLYEVDRGSSATVTADSGAGTITITAGSGAALRVWDMCLHGNVMTG